MIFSYKLLLSEKFDNPGDILNGLKQGVLPKSCFLLCINNASSNIMDIYYSEEFQKPYVNADDLLIIAICKDKRDAKDKCAELIGDYLAKNKSFDGFKDNFIAK